MVYFYISYNHIATFFLFLLQKDFEIFHELFLQSFLISLITLNTTTPWGEGRGGGERGAIDAPCGFLKNVSSKERVKPWLFVTFNIIIISHTFLKISLNFLKLFRRYEELLCQYQLFSSILSIFRDFFDVSLLQRNC